MALQSRGFLKGPFALWTLFSFSLFGPVLDAREPAREKEKRESHRIAGGLLKRMGDPAQFSAAELKNELKRMGVATNRVEGCFEKRDLIALYNEAKDAEQSKRRREREEMERQRLERQRQYQQQQPRSDTKSSRPSQARAAYSQAGGIGLGNVSWQTIVMGGLILLFLYNHLVGPGRGRDGAGQHDDDEIDFSVDSDRSYVQGKVAEVSTLAEFQSALKLHKDHTGLPVVVDFFSHSCGPCVMIAPTFRRLAKEFKKRAVFLKVDVNRNYQTSSACSIRAMPTFQFYLGGKKIHEFSGADSRRLRAVTSDLASRAEKRGTFVNKFVKEEALEAFYKVKDPKKLSDVPVIAEKYRRKTAKLVRLLKRKYDDVPSLTDVEEEAEGKKKKADAGGSAPNVDRNERQMNKDEAEDSDSDADVFTTLKHGIATAENPTSVVIIGGGPAGLTAGIYCARAGMKPIIVSPAFGGQLLGKGVEVENFPGVVGSVATGRGIVTLMRRQAVSFGAVLLDDVVVNIDTSVQPFRLQLNTSRANGSPLVAHTIILAMGASTRWLRVDGEHDFRGRGVSSCATCDGFLYRGKDVLVIGGGDTAMEDALVLARTSKSVTIVHRRDTFRASKVLRERVLSSSKIRIIWNASAVRFGGSDALDFVDIVDHYNSQRSQLKVAAAFVAIGHDPNTEMLQGQVDLKKNGYIVTKAHSTETSMPGIFAAGDVADSMYRQAVTSAGSGAMAALDAERFLSTSNTHH